MAKETSLRSLCSLLSLVHSLLTNQEIGNRGEGQEKEGILDEACHVIPFHLITSAFFIYFLLLVVSLSLLFYLLIP